MRQASLPLPEIAALAATRGMIGAGIGLLVANKIRPRRRIRVGLPLLIIGALSTIPFAIDIFRKAKANPF